MPETEDLTAFDVGEHLFDGSEWQQFRAAAVYNIKTVISMILVAVLAFDLLMTLFRVRGIVGVSMYPALNDGDVVVETNLVSDVDYGDIISCHVEGIENDIIKRVIGLPGDVITMDVQNNKVYRNGELLDEPYVSSPLADFDLSPVTGRELRSVTVEEGKVFVMGDNRAVSMDSRMSAVGQIPFENITSKYLFTIPFLNGQG